MIVISGASKGIGLAISKHLINLNYPVLGLARNIKELDFPCEKCDVSSFSQIKKIVQKLKKNKTKVSGLINAAGIASMNLAITTPSNVTQKILNTNLAGTIFCCQLFAPLMVREKKGTIINFSTIAVSLGLKGESIYIASKAGIEGFTKSFAREMSNFEISVNCIAPGPINTNLIKGVSKKAINNIIKNQIIQKQFKPKDICDVVELLLDKKSKSISGQIINIGGV